MKTKNKVLAIVVAFVFANSCFLYLAYSLTPVFSFEELFPAGQQRAMGLHKLNGEEKEALRAHVEKLLALAVDTTRKPVTPAPPAPAAVGRYLGVGGGHWVQQNIDSGAFILLEDGSLWQIDPLEKIDAMLWLPMDNITVIDSNRGSLGYNYLLINTDDGDKAHAKYVGRQ